MKASSPTTWWPSRSRRSHRCEPMNPAAPVTRHFMGRPPATWHTCCGTGILAACPATVPSRNWLEGEAMSEITHSTPRSRIPLLALVLELLAHALCWAAFLGAWVVVPARLDHTFRDYNMKLPWATELVMSLWRTTSPFFVLMPLFLLL